MKRTREPESPFTSLIPVIYVSINNKIIKGRVTLVTHNSPLMRF